MYLSKFEKKPKKISFGCPFSFLIKIIEDKANSFVKQQFTFTTLIKKSNGHLVIFKKPKIAQRSNFL